MASYARFLLGFRRAWGQRPAVEPTPHAHAVLAWPSRLVAPAALGRSLLHADAKPADAAPPSRARGVRDRRRRDPRRHRPPRAAREGDRSPPPRGLRPHARRARPRRAGRARDAHRGGVRPPRARHRHALHRGRRAVRIPVPPGERLGQRRDGPQARSTTRRGCAASIAARPAGPTRSRASAVTRRAGPTAPARRRRTRSCAATASGSAARTSAIRRISSVSVRSRCLAREMSAELRAQAAAAARAREGGRTPGRAGARPPRASRSAASPPSPTARSTTARWKASIADLTVRPFGWKGHQATLRDMAEESLHIHQGLLSNRIQLAVRDGSLDRGPYGKGKWYDVDEDGVSLEIDAGHADDRRRLPGAARGAGHAPAARSRAARRVGRRSHRTSTTIGCAGCHVPTLELDDPKLDARATAGPDRPAVRHRRRQGRRRSEDRAQVRAGPTTPYLVHLFSDLKRHDMGDALATPGAAGDDSRAACSSPGRSGVSPRRRRTCTTAARRPCTTRSCSTAARRPRRATPTWRSTRTGARACASSSRRSRAQPKLFVP